MSEFGVPTAGQLEKINALAKRPLDKAEVFVFNAKLAGDMVIPDRYIQLSKPLLNVFKQNAIDGVAFLLDHSWASSGLFGMGGRPKAAIPYGRTFDAKLKKSEVDGESWSLYADHYMARGIEIDGVSTDSLIASIEAGTMFDTSIGWGANQYECSVCGKDIRRCEHSMGRTYETEGQSEAQLCYAIAKPPGFLMENSAVFDGAYPTAGFLSQMGAGESEPGNMIMVENIKELPIGVMAFNAFSAHSNKLFIYAKKDDLAKENVFTVPDLSNLKGGGKQVSEEVKTYTQEEVDALLKEAADSAVKEALAKQAIEIQASAEPLHMYMTQAQVVEKLGKELPADKVLSYAKEGEAYMTQLIEDAVAMGVRAQGNDFPAETWKNTFAGMGSQGIKDIMATFEKQAKEEIPAGRQSKAKVGDAQTQAEIPDECFKV